MPTNWSLSPDGSQLAIILYRPDQGTIHPRSRKSWCGHCGLSGGRNTLFVATMDSERKTALFNVKLDGSNYLLLKGDNDSIEWAIPSPDGKLLAINKYTGITNVWSLAHF